MAELPDSVHFVGSIARDDDPFFAPLDKLHLKPGTELILGLVHADASRLPA